MNVNLESFRSLAQGTHNLGSVVISTDATTHEQHLGKVDNHKYLVGFNVAPTEAENVKTRQVLSDLMKARLQQIGGADLARDEKLSAEFGMIDKLLLGKNIRENLDRKGTLAQAFKVFDFVEARLLRTRAVTDQLRTANAASVTVGSVSVRKPSETDMSGQAKAEDAPEVADRPETASENASATTKSVLFNDGTSSEPWVVVESNLPGTDAEGNAVDEVDVTKQIMDVKLSVSRQREVVESRLEGMWKEHPECAPQASHAGKATDSARKLRAEDQTIVDLLTKDVGAEEMKLAFAKHPVEAHAIQAEISGALRYLARIQADRQPDKPAASKTVSVKVYADNAKIPTTTMDITLKPDGRLELGVRGHRFELSRSAGDLDNVFKAASFVNGIGAGYFSTFDAENHTRAHENVRDWFTAWKGNGKDVDVDAFNRNGDLVHKGTGAVRMLPPENQQAFAGKIEEMLETLRQENNSSPQYWGGSPHFGNNMPQLDPVKLARFGGRTEAHIRTYCNQQIQRGGLHALFGRFLSKVQGVPLESGAHCGISDTLFEKAALFLNKVRLLALNLNWICTQFENQPGESDQDAIERVCQKVSEICQLQLHPGDQGVAHTKAGLLEEIRTLVQTTVNGYEAAKAQGDLKGFFTMLTQGACFQGCTTNVAEYCEEVVKASSEIKSEYPEDVKKEVGRLLDEEKRGLETELARVGDQIRLLGERKTSFDPAGPDDPTSKLDALEKKREALEAQIRSLGKRDLGTGGVYVKDGQVVVSLLPEKEPGKKAAKAADTSSAALEWSSTPPIAAQIIPRLVREVYREAVDKGQGKGPFHVLTVDDMVAKIIEKLKPLDEVAAQKGPGVKRELEAQLGKLAAKQDALATIVRYMSLTDRYAAIQKSNWFRNAGMASRSGNKEEVARLNSLPEGIEFAQVREEGGKARNVLKEAWSKKVFEADEAGGQFLKKTFGAQGANKAQPQKQKIVNALKDVQEQIRLLKTRLGNVGHFELNLQDYVKDKDGNWVDVEKFVPFSDDVNSEAYQTFKETIVNALKDSGYVYTPGEKPRFVVGEESLLFTSQTRVRGAGFLHGPWNGDLHGREFFKGVSENGDVVFRSNEGLEIFNPSLSRDISRRNCDGDDYQYEDGDILLQDLV